jgi:hypothetical protein
MTLRQQLYATITNSEKKIEGLMGEVAKVRGIINCAQEILSSQSTLDFEISLAPEVAQVRSQVVIKPPRRRYKGELTTAEVLRKNLCAAGPGGLSRQDLIACAGPVTNVDDVLALLRKSGEVIRPRKAHYVSKKFSGMS